MDGKETSALGQIIRLLASEERSRWEVLKAEKISDDREVWNLTIRAMPRGGEEQEAEND